MAINPYGVTIASPGSTLLPARITDMQNLHMGWQRYQVDWANIETAPGVYTWTKLDDDVSKCNAAGISVIFPIQNGPSFGITNWTETDIAGMLAHVVDTIPIYLNQGGGICQIVFTGSTWNAGTAVVLESSANGFSWTLMQTWSSNPGTVYVDVTNLWFIRLRAATLQSGDSIVAATITEEQNKQNHGTITSTSQSVFAHLNNDTVFYEFAFSGVMHSGSTLLLQQSADNVTFTTFQTLTGSGVQPASVFGSNPTVTTSSGAIPAGSQTVQPLSMANISIGTQLTIDKVKSGVQEIVTVSSVTGTTFTATFANTHGANCPIYLAVFLRAKPSSWQAGDSVVVTISGTGPSAAGKNYLNPSNVLSFAQAVAHRYTVGDPANVNGMHIEAIEIGNEGYDDSSDALLKTPYWLVQAQQACYAAIKAINPAMLVGSGTHLQINRQHTQTWQQAWYLYGGAGYSDYSQLHYYPGQYDPTTIVSGQSADMTFTQYWQAVHAIDVANGNGSLPIRVGEFGWTRGQEDDFTSNDSSLYTSDHMTGGSNGSWAFDLPDGQIVGTGGSNAVYYQTSNPAKFQGGFDEILVNWCEEAGFGLRWIDANNSYLCKINDASSATNPNTVQLIVRSAGVNNVVASVPIAFPRGSSHLFHFQAIGHTPVNAQTTLVITMDGTQLISYGDTTAGNQAGGYAYLYENGKLVCQHFSMIQDGSVTQVQQAQYIQDVFESGRSSGGVVQVVCYFTLDNSNNYSPVSVSHSIETQYPAYWMWANYAAFYPTWPGVQEFIIVNAKGRDNTVMVARRDNTTAVTRRDNSATTTRRDNVAMLTRRDNTVTAIRRDNIVTTTVRA